MTLDFPVSCWTSCWKPLWYFPNSEVLLSWVQFYSISWRYPIVQEAVSFLCIRLFVIVTASVLMSFSLCLSVALSFLLFSSWLPVSRLHALPHEPAGSDGPIVFQVSGPQDCMLHLHPSKCVGRGSSHHSVAQTPSTSSSRVQNIQTKYRKTAMKIGTKKMFHK